MAEFLHRSNRIRSGKPQWCGHNSSFFVSSPIAFQPGKTKPESARAHRELRQTGTRVNPVFGTRCPVRREAVVPSPQAAQARAARVHCRPGSGRGHQTPVATRRPAHTGQQSLTNGMIAAAIEKEFKGSTQIRQMEHIGDHELHLGTGRPCPMADGRLGSDRSIRRPLSCLLLTTCCRVIYIARG